MGGVRTEELELNAVQSALLHPLPEPVLPFGHVARYAQYELLFKV